MMYLVAGLTLVGCVLIWKGAFELRKIHVRKIRESKNRAEMVEFLRMDMGKIHANEYF